MKHDIVKTLVRTICIAPVLLVAWVFIHAVMHAQTAIQATVLMDKLSHSKVIPPDPTKYTKYYTHRQPNETDYVLHYNAALNPEELSANGWTQIPPDPDERQKVELQRIRSLLQTAKIPADIILATNVFEKSSSRFNAHLALLCHTTNAFLVVKQINAP